MNSTLNGSLYPSTIADLVRDLTAGIVVFLVALPLCLGIALASNAPPIAGVLAGVIGGVLVGILSGSHTSVTGPAAGLTAIVAAQITGLGSFEAFLMAVAIAGVIQIGLGIAKAGFIASFFPSSVIKGLLAAIGVILILKQLPHVLGHESISEIISEDMADIEGGNNLGHKNPLYSLIGLLSGTFHVGPLMIGVISLLVLVGWDRGKKLKKSIIPSPLVVVVLGIALASFFNWLGGIWLVSEQQLVNVPVASGIAEFASFLKFPDFKALFQPAVILAGFTIAIVATLESMLNLEAVDNLDPKQRVSPPNRELIAQGIGNLTAGLIGGLPMTSVVVRGSVNINAGAQTKLSTIVHGFVLFAFALWLPKYLNLIPLSCLAAILLVTGFKLANPKLVLQLYEQGRLVFLPFVITVVAIVMTDLLMGILIGLGVALLFILSSNYKRPIRKIIERHIGDEVHHIELANQVSFLSRAVLEKSLRETPRGGHVLLDARHTDYIDPDILSLIRDFKQKTAPALGVNVSLRGFNGHDGLQDDLQYVDYTTHELQRKLSPKQVLDLLIEGNERFRSGHCLPRDLKRQVAAMAHGQYPMAVVLSCMDSRTPTELLFDRGIGDLLNVCQAGTSVLGPPSIASIEYGCAVAGAKLIVVMGHTRSTVVEAALEAVCVGQGIDQYGEHFEHIVSDIRPSIDDDVKRRFSALMGNDRMDCVDDVALKHVLRTVQLIPERSHSIRNLLDQQRIAIIAAMYDVRNGSIDFHRDSAIGLIQSPDLDEVSG